MNERKNKILHKINENLKSCNKKTGLPPRVILNMLSIPVDSSFIQTKRLCGFNSKIMIFNRKLMNLQSTIDNPSFANLTLKMQMRLKKQLSVLLK